MKVKNIAFSGFAAAVLATGAANAAPSIATQGYVDQQVKGVQGTVTELNKTLTEQYTKTEQLQTVVNQNITQAIESDTGAIKEALNEKADASTVTTLAGTVTDLSGVVAQKENSSNKTGSITEANQGSAELFPTIGAVVTWTNAQIADLSETGLPVNPDNIGAGTIVEAKLADGSVTTPKIADKAVTSGKLADDVNAKINAAQTAEQVAAAIASAVTTEGGEIKTELDKKIPTPSADCKSASGRCVLSVDTNGNYTWIDVTTPLETSAAAGE